MRVGQSRRRDRAEAGIVKALRQIGASVMRVSEKGAMDLVVWMPGCGVVLLEVKSAHGAATKAQEAKAIEGWPVVTVRSIQDALKAVGVLETDW